MQQYHQRSRSLTFSLLFILPLLILYEAWLLIFRPTVVNAAGSALRLPFEYLLQIIHNFGAISFLNATLLFNFLLIVIFLAAYHRTRKQGEIQLGLFFPMLLESALYGFFLGRSVSWVMNQTSRVLPSPLATPAATVGTFDSVMLSVGAGVYEEIVFRLLLVGGLFLTGMLIFEKKRLHLAVILLVAAAVALAAVRELATREAAFEWQKVAAGMLLNAPLFAGLGALFFALHCCGIWLLLKLGMKPPGAVGFASVLFGALLFSAFHHVGSLGDPLEARVFFFRFLAGLLLSIIYLVRGLGIAVYTHAFYDILVVLSQPS